MQFYKQGFNDKRVSKRTLFQVELVQQFFILCAVNKAPQAYQSRDQNRSISLKHLSVFQKL